MLTDDSDNLNGTQTAIVTKFLSQEINDKIKHATTIEDNIELLVADMQNETNNSSYLKNEMVSVCMYVPYFLRDYWADPIR